MSMRARHSCSLCSCRYENGEMKSKYHWAFIVCRGWEPERKRKIEPRRTRRTRRKATKKKETHLQELFFVFFVFQSFDLAFERRSAHREQLAAHPARAAGAAGHGGDEVARADRLGQVI